MKQILGLLIAFIMADNLQAQTFTLKSDDLEGQLRNKQFGNTMACKGENVSPELHWQNAPKETRAFAVSMYDMDAPTGSGFWHWVLYNIPVSVTSLKSDAGNVSQQNLPPGAVCGKNDLGTFAYIGACPPLGQTHRYIITLVALKDSIRIDKNASPALVGFMVNRNALAKASLIAYGQQ